MEDKKEILKWIDVAHSRLETIATIDKYNTEIRRSYTDDITDEQKRIKREMQSIIEVEEKERRKSVEKNKREKIKQRKEQIIADLKVEYVSVLTPSARAYVQRKFGDTRFENRRSGKTIYFLISNALNKSDFNEFLDIITKSNTRKKLGEKIGETFSLMGLCDRIEASLSDNDIALIELYKMYIKLLVW